MKLAPTLQAMMFDDFAAGDFAVAKRELRALLAVARAAHGLGGESCCGIGVYYSGHGVKCKLGRALARLERVSKP